MWAHSHVCVIGDSGILHLSTRQSMNGTAPTAHCYCSKHKKLPHSCLCFLQQPPIAHSTGKALEPTSKGPYRHNPETSDDVNQSCCCKSSTLEVHKLKICLLHVHLVLKYSSVFLCIDINRLHKSHKFNMSYLLKQKLTGKNIHNFSRHMNILH